MIKKIKVIIIGFILLINISFWLGCEKSKPNQSHDDHDHSSHSSSSSKKIAIPPAVQNNLGITFATVEKKVINDILRLPGQFELLPTAKLNVHSPLSGRMTLMVKQFDTVESGQLLAEVESPDWQDMQAAITQAIAAIEIAEADVVVAHEALHEQQRHATILQERIDRLAIAEVRRIDLENELAHKQHLIPTRQATLDAKKAIAQQAQLNLQALLYSASAKSGIPIETLIQQKKDKQFWQTLNKIPIVATNAGIVNSINVSNGSWVKSSDHLMTVIQPDQIRFKVEALLSELSRLTTGLPVTIVPPIGLDTDPSHSITTTLFIGPTAHAEDRALHLYANLNKTKYWTKPGLAGFMEIQLNPTSQPVLAIPQKALIQDGLDVVYFLRDPWDPDKAIRTIADSGEANSRWIEIKSGVDEGDEVVLDGNYQLLTASSQSIQKGGHFHSDGTFHEGEDH